MSNDIKGLERWEEEAKEYDRKAGDYRMRAGSGLVSAVENWYRAWNEKPTVRTTREYQTWRLRLHRKWNAYPEFLKELDDLFPLGLHDEKPGPTFWHVPAERRDTLRDPFNWRRESGDALRGRKPAELEEEPQEDLEE